MATAPPEDDPEAVRRAIEYGASYLRDAEKLGASSQTQHDQMLIWSIGLMAAGAVAAYSHLPSRTRWMALSPWMLGILLAIAARLVGRVLWDRESLQQFKKIQGLLGMLLDSPAQTQDLIIRARAVIRNEVEFRQPQRTIERLKRCSEVLGWSTHILFAVGVIIVFWVLA